MNPKPSQKGNVIGPWSRWVGPIARAEFQIGGSPCKVYVGGYMAAKPSTLNLKLYHSSHSLFHYPMLNASKRILSARSIL